jgi:hypothetical protein
MLEDAGELSNCDSQMMQGTITSKLVVAMYDVAHS